jgi:hypothetical protein
MSTNDSNFELTKEITMVIKRLEREDSLGRNPNARLRMSISRQDAKHPRSNQPHPRAFRQATEPRRILKQRRHSECYRRALSVKVKKCDDRNSNRLTEAAQRTGIERHLIATHSMMFDHMN